MAKNFSRVYAAQPYQLSGHIVSVEIDITNGMHSFSVVGLPDKAVEEARDRVGSAIKNSGYVSPKQENQKTVVSLAPAELRKEGSYFDLAIAVGYLLASREIMFDPEHVLFIGELSLNGELQPVTGILPIVQEAKRLGFKEIFVPVRNAEEAALISDIQIYPSPSLKDVLRHVDQETDEPVRIPAQNKTELPQVTPSSVLNDFSDIRGQESAKRGLEIAAAGGHNALMSGPPGTGKTMLAKAFSGILPPLSEEAMLETTGIHSIAGILRDTVVLHPPFRSPHHTSSYVSVIGGGSIPKPGEVTLAHRGVLFLDEFPEFDKRVIESLRQPMEDRVVHISRARGAASFPAGFTLIAAMNPCPCGNFGSLSKPCVCTPNDLARYRRRISGPIADRIDLWMNVEHIDYDKLAGIPASTETSSDIAERVAQARRHQEKRFGSPSKLNAHMHARDIDQLNISPEALATLREGAANLKLSPRAFHRTIKVAQTIADLANVNHIAPEHVLEAFQYRPRI